MLTYVDKINFFAKNVKALRIDKDKTQAEIAADIGFKQTQWSSYETGASTPVLKDLIKIIDYFGISSTDLLETDLENVHLNEPNANYKKEKNVHPKVHRNVHPNELKYTTEQCNHCLILNMKDELIDSLKAQIKMLEKQLEKNK